jgi:hypothetical protein
MVGILEEIDEQMTVLFPLSMLFFDVAFDFYGRSEKKNE